jgi:hypothetical protein
MDSPVRKKRAAVEITYYTKVHKSVIMQISQSHFDGRTMSRTYLTAGSRHLCASRRHWVTLIHQNSPSFARSRSCATHGFADGLNNHPRNTPNSARTCGPPAANTKRYRLQPNDLRIHSVAHPVQNSLNPEDYNHFARPRAKPRAQLERGMGSLAAARNPSILCRVVP